ncbi:MAG TPA: hypothetical protein VFZ09_02955 [Archangium sp.]|uniref:hypothetical protein n=1 Tax=Archangium sp. TaxID=1872627 RepID=UPI002E31BBDE|nr:hypothetical protein [Archangium sp.]HEX5745173.1 hypothetical protein [Archangium sp.]
MTRVRDESIEQWDGLIAGQLKGNTAARVNELLAGWSDEQRAVLNALVPAIVDTTLHHLLWTIEQEETVSLSMIEGPQLRDVSDGLAGDLIGWKKRYSKQRDF